MLDYDRQLTSEESSEEEYVPHSVLAREALADASSAGDAPFLVQRRGRIGATVPGRRRQTDRTSAP